MESKGPFKVVGKSIPRHESFARVTGQARYTDDLDLPGMVYGSIFRSPYAHARILHIDPSEAEKVDGVLAILLPEDDAQAEIHDRDGLKVVPLRDRIHRPIADGNEKFLLTGIVIPHLPEGTWGRFIKSGLRAAIDFAMINMAIRFSPASGPKQQVPVLRIFVGALAPEPIALDETAEYLVSNLSKLPFIKEEMKERTLKEMRAKSALIRETGISIKSKKNAFYIVSSAIGEWF
jgi:hypothetical protein